MTEQFREELKDMADKNSIVRITGILNALDIAHSSWYRKPVPASERKRPGPVRKPVEPEIERVVIYYAKLYPWYGYKKIAVICRRSDLHRQKVLPAYQGFIFACSYSISHAYAAWFVRTISPNAETRRSLLAVV